MFATTPHGPQSIVSLRPGSPSVFDVAADDIGEERRLVDQTPRMRRDLFRKGQEAASSQRLQSHVEHFPMLIILRLTERSFAGRRSLGRKTRYLNPLHRDGPPPRRSIHAVLRPEFDLGLVLGFVQGMARRLSRLLVVKRTDDICFCKWHRGDPTIPRLHRDSGSNIEQRFAEALEQMRIGRDQIAGPLCNLQNEGNNVGRQHWGNR